MWKRFEIILLCLIYLSAGTLGGYAWSDRKAQNSILPEIRWIRRPEGASAPAPAQDAFIRSVPEGAHYIASAKGKYYYSVFDPRARKLSAKYRRFFTDRESAEKAGFQKR